MSQKLSHIKSFWVALVAARGVGGCLPADTRPPPAALTVTGTPDAALEMGIAESSTIDGWNIKFERFLLSLGYASFGGDDSFSPADSCDSYAGANYGRIFELTTTGPQHVSTLYGLGDCPLGFRVPSPSTDVLLGSSVNEADKSFMRTKATDAY